MSQPYIWRRAGWPHLIWDTDTLLLKICAVRQLQGYLSAKVESLSLESRTALREATMTNNALASAAIDGARPAPDVVSSYVRRSYASSPHESTTPSGADMGVEGFINVLFDALENHEAPMTEDRLFSWHAALFPTGYSGLKIVPLSQWRAPGSLLRVTSGLGAREKEHFEAPPSEALPELMQWFFAWWEDTAGALDGLLRAGLAHLYFATIHPFSDGNGRLARALTDLALAQDEGRTLGRKLRCYSLCAQMRRERWEYYANLEAAQKGDCDATSWLAWFLGCYERALVQAEKEINNADFASRFWRNLEGRSVNSRQRRALNMLLEAGPDEFKDGLSNKQYRAMTRTSAATAARDLAGLVDMGALRKLGGGRSVRYELMLLD